MATSPFLFLESVLKKDPIKIVLILAILVFGALTVFVEQKKVKSPQAVPISEVETVEIKPNITLDAKNVDESESDTEVFLDQESADSPKEKVFQSITLERADLDHALQDLSKVLMSARATPYKNSKEEIVGFQLLDIQFDSVFTKLGFRNRDIVVQVNDQLLQSAAGTVTMFSSLASMKNVKIKVVRGRTLGHLMVTVRN
ncbi:MAG: hypothetical protein JNL11_03115 [Bdellovibrionaceae bacterium]|nr:hypothetical protein [Pseudobdellovibrionaceae bacterium]